MDDWGVFFDPNEFGDLVVWVTQHSETVNLYGIFEAAREAVLPGDAVGVSTVLPVLTVAESEIPATAAQGDDLEVRGKNYRVSDTQPDGSGLARIILERI